jgi:hypothetical protein
MARAQVELVCDKCSKHFLWAKNGYANRAEANQATEWARSNVTLCPTCYEEACEKERRKKAELKRQEEAARCEQLQPLLEELGFPCLTGSEKQVAWANIIRANAVYLMMSEDDLLKGFVTWACTKKEATWWIEHRKKIDNILNVYYLYIKDIWYTYYRCALKCHGIVNPKIPVILIGHQWNQRIYGKSGSYAVYLDYEKYALTDAQAKEIRSYQTNKIKYEQQMSKFDDLWKAVNKKDTDTVRHILGL